MGPNKTLATGGGIDELMTYPGTFSNALNHYYITITLELSLFINTLGDLVLCPFRSPIYFRTVTIFATFCWWLLIVTETGNGHVRRTGRHSLLRSHRHSPAAPSPKLPVLGSSPTWPAAVTLIRRSPTHKHTGTYTGSVDEGDAD